MKEFIIFISGILCGIWIMWIGGLALKSVESDLYKIGYLDGTHACQVSNERLDELQTRIPLEINQ